MRPEGVEAVLSRALVPIDGVTQKPVANLLEFRRRETRLDDAHDLKRIVLGSEGTQEALFLEAADGWQNMAANRPLALGDLNLEQA